MFDFHRRILQVLQHGAAPRTWLLKTPGHLMTLDLLFATYPDAWVVQTHRDPAKTMPSTVSTTAMVQWLRTDQIDLDLLAAAISGAFTFALNGVAERARQARSARPLRGRPLPGAAARPGRDAARGLRRAWAARFSDEHAEAIRRYLAEKPKGKFGVHQYSPEEWGFSAAGLRTSLAPYIAHFGVALE